MICLQYRTSFEDGVCSQPLLEWYRPRVKVLTRSQGPDVESRSWRNVSKSRVYTRRTHCVLETPVLDWIFDQTPTNSSITKPSRWHFNRLTFWFFIFLISIYLCMYLRCRSVNYHVHVLSSILLFRIFGCFSFYFSHWH